MVITKGAARMAEVGARFALDGMPGKQLAIDSDMSAGAIDHQEAKARREREQQETTFFGSLDGASKFVKGDAIAGLLITLLNLVMGLAIGTIGHGMPLATAVETYAILTVGDGLVTQIPAVIISIASALLLARGGAQGATDQALAGQLGRHPSAITTVAVLMGLFALVPGLPFLPFILGGLALGLTAGWMYRRDKLAEGDAAEPAATETQAAQRSLGDMLDLDDIHVEFSPDLVNMVLDPGTGLDVRIANMREHVATTYGLILPEIRLTDEPALSDGTYVIRIQGVEQGRGRLRDGQVLMLDAAGQVPESAPAGERVTEPVYGAPARWIPEATQETAALSGCTLVAPTEVLATHLLEVIRRNLSRLLTMKSLRRLLDETVNLTDPGRAEANRKLLDEMIPDRVPPDILLAVLRLLLAEEVSIRNLPVVLEAIAEGRQVHKQPEALCEHVRQRLGFQLVAGLQRAEGLDVALPPELFNKLTAAVAEQLDTAAESGISPAIVTSAPRRRFLRTVLAAKKITAPVLSFEEIGTEARPALVGTVPA
jgi:flagellar biosynthesis protein FlhA